MGALKLREGDYVPDERGGLAVLSGAEEVLNRVLFLLTARRGAFPLLPEVGSRLHLLLREKPSARQALAEQYAAEALAGETEVALQQVLWDEAGSTLRLELVWQGETLHASVAL